MGVGFFPGRSRSSPLLDGDGQGPPPRKGTSTQRTPPRILPAAFYRVNTKDAPRSHSRGNKRDPAHPLIRATFKPRWGRHTCVGFNYLGSISGSEFPAAARAYVCPWCCPPRACSVRECVKRTARASSASSRCGVPLDHAERGPAANDLDGPKRHSLQEKLVIMRR
jgi:hypothetical protein